MTVKEEIITGRKWRRLIDKVAGLWQRISYWTHSTDVEFEDGKNAETKVGAIDGITDSLVSTSSNIAASAKALSQVNNNLMLIPEFIIDPTTGEITGYKTKDGADAVHPFSNFPDILFEAVSGSDTYHQVSSTVYVPKGYKKLTTNKVSGLSINGMGFSGDISNKTYDVAEGDKVTIGANYLNTATAYLHI